MALWRIRATVEDRPGYLSVLTTSLALRSVNSLRRAHHRGDRDGTMVSVTLAATSLHNPRDLDRKCPRGGQAAAPERLLRCCACPLAEVAGSCGSGEW
jgi:hypothetical protein